MDFTDEQILQNAETKLCVNHELQIAHDRMLLGTGKPDSDEYGKAWKRYLAAGGSRSMVGNYGIDENNFRRLREQREAT